MRSKNWDERINPEAFITCSSRVGIMVDPDL